MSLNIKNSLIILLFAFCSCNHHYTKQGKIQLDFNLSINQDTFSLTEPILCTFKLRNRSKVSIGLQGGLNLGFLDDSDANLNLLIKKNTVPFKNPKDLHYHFIKDDAISFIEKDEFWEATFDVAPFYPLKEAGLYSIQAQFVDKVFLNKEQYDSFDIKSNQQQIVIR